ncbi:MAG: STAS domain-containing protein [Ktedonobacterales bacterium]
MADTAITMTVRRVDAQISIIDITGDITAFAEPELMRAYAEATEPAARAVVLNFTGLQYMNSSGIGLIVTLLIRMNRLKQRLLAYGLSEHYTHIFELTRLNEAIGVYPTENAAVAAAARER